MSSVATVAPDTASDRSDDALYARVTRRLVPLLFLCYVAAYLDRMNVGFAKLQMLRDLGFSETVYGLGAGIFFVGYFLFEVPSNVILHRVGARRWIARIMATWAVISAATAFVRSPAAFYVLRFLLGVAEAGLFPGVIYYLTHWFPAARRGRIVALFMTGIPVSGAIGGPLSGWILGAMNGALGLAGWQWLFIIEALPSLVLAVVVLRALDDRVAHARWLSPDECERLERCIDEERRTIGAHRLIDGFRDPRVWLLAATYFLLVACSNAIGLWLPTLLKRSGVESPLTIGVLSLLPHTAAIVAMVAVGRHADATRERRWHIALPGVVGAIGWVVAARGGGSPAITLAGLTLATAGALVTISQFWSLPTALLAGAAAAAGIALVNSIGNLAGFVGPSFIGWTIDRTHSTDLGVYALAASATLGSMLVLAMPARVVNR